MVLKRIQETLLKFGLKYCDLPTMVWNTDCTLRALSLNIDSRNTKRISVFAYLLCLLCTLCYGYVYIFCVIWFVFVRCRETGDMVSGIIVLSLGLASETGIMKLFYISFYQKSIREIVDGYLACDALVIPDSRFARNLMTHLKIVKKRALIFVITLITNGAFYVVKAFLRPGRHMLEDVFVFYGLEPMYETPNYEIAITINSIAVMFTVYVAASLTAFLIILTGYTQAQMLALSEELKSLWDDAINRFPLVNQGTQKLRNDYIKHNLDDIVKGHSRNIILIQKIENVFRSAIAIEFVFLITGLLAELLGKFENTYVEIPFTLMNVATDCFIGQNIIDASIVFEKAVYDSNWEQFDVSNMKIVLLMLKNSQRNMKLSSGGIAILSFPCFMSVIRTTYSAYTTLRKA